MLLVKLLFINSQKKTWMRVSSCFKSGTLTCLTNLTRFFLGNNLQHKATARKNIKTQVTVSFIFSSFVVQAVLGCYTISIQSPIYLPRTTWKLICEDLLTQRGMLIMVKVPTAGQRMYSIATLGCCSRQL